MSIHAKIHRANQLFKTGQFQEAKALCHTVLKKNRHDYKALQLYGMLLLQIGKPTESINYFLKARKKNQLDHELNSNLGLAYFNSGQFDKAERTLALALEQKPCHAPALMNLALLYLKTQRIEDAIEKATLAHKHDETLYQALNCLALCYFKQGEFQQSVDRLIQSIQVNDTIPETFQLIAKALMAMQNGNEAIYYLERGLRLPQNRPGDKLELLIAYLIITWLQGDLKKTGDLINTMNQLILDAQKSRFSNPEILKQITNLSGFSQCLDFAFQYRSQHPTDYLDKNKRIYFLCESHCLSSHGINVSFDNERYSIHSIFIRGAKAFHFAKPDWNEFKAGLNIALESVEGNAPIMIGFGEIDCRINEGIYAVCKKKQLNHTENVQTLVQGYIDYLKTLFVARENPVIIYGCPAPNSEAIKSLDEDEHGEFVDLVYTFNETLKQKAREAGWKFLDVYAITLGENKVSNGSYHYDNHHISPKAIQRLFELDH